MAGDDDEKVEAIPFKIPPDKKKSKSESLTPHKLRKQKSPDEQTEEFLLWVKSYQLSKNSGDIEKNMKDGAILMEMLDRHLPASIKVFPQLVFPIEKESDRTYNWEVIKKFVAKEIGLDITEKLIKKLFDRKCSGGRTILEKLRKKLERLELGKHHGHNRLNLITHDVWKLIHRKSLIKRMSCFALHDTVVKVEVKVRSSPPPKK